MKRFILAALVVVVLFLVPTAVYAVAEIAEVVESPLPWWAMSILTAAGFILAIPAAASWGKSKGRELGRQMAKVIPGDKIESWLAQFLNGFNEGLLERDDTDIVDITPALDAKSISIEFQKRF